MKIFNLALSTIRSAKGEAVSLFILIFMAGMLLNVGMTVIVKMNTFFDTKVEELNEPHLSILMKRTNDKEAYSDFFKKNSSVKAAEKESILLMEGTKFRYGDSDLSISIALLDADSLRDFTPLRLIDKLDAPVQNDDIYLPYSFKASAGYKQGDRFTMNFQGKPYSFRIAGFFQTAALGMPSMGIMKFFLPDTAYRQLDELTGEITDGTLLSASLHNMKESTQLLNEYNKEFPDSSFDVTSPLFWETDILMVKSTGSMTINIVAMILVAFAAVIVAVSLIVIQFRVINRIEDSMVNIGVLKAIGYTTTQIVASIVVQFMLITISASVVGVAVSYAVVPVFGTVITSLSGLLWSPGFDGSINIASILILVILVLIVTMLSSIRIRKLHPVIALRGGIRTHSFRKNVFPLEKARGGLQFVLACKTMLINTKQNIMIVFIIAAVTFASVFSVVLYYNIATDKTAFVHLVGAETSNVMLQSKSSADSRKLIDGIEQMDGVTKTAILDLVFMKLDGHSVYTNISDDFSKLNNQMVYEGRNPEYDNEIAITWPVAELLHKEIGDTIQVSVGEASHSYLITGLSQAISNMGQGAFLTVTGVRKIIPAYTGANINVYLKGIDNDSFIQQVQAQYGDLINDSMDMTEMINGQSSIYISAVFAVMIVVLAITALVVILILYLVIKKMILKRKKELGIFKATGYTTLQLMTQIALSFIPIVIAGVSIGGILGCFYTNSMLTLLLSGAGIHNVQFIVNIPLIVVICSSLILLAYLISMFVSYGIRRITAYGLITE